MVQPQEGLTSVMTAVSAETFVRRKVNVQLSSPVFRLAVFSDWSGTIDLSSAGAR